MSSNAADTRDHPYQIAAQALKHNPGQWQAYESAGNCVILAGPGSGKTKTLTIKLARLLTESIRPPRQIACITYNNECVRELRVRLKALGIDERRNTFIGTVHSFCLQHVIQPYASLAGVQLPNPLNVATPAEQAELFDLSVRNALSSDERAGDFKNRFDCLRSRVLDRTHDDWEGSDPRIARLVEYYESSLRDRGFIDFDDMALIGHRIISQHSWVRRALKARFPILVIDEYQDLGTSLHEIVMSLISSGVRILAVGDPNQSIYGFTGAMPKLLNTLSEHPSVEVARLNFNYRCGRSIVKTSHITIPPKVEEIPQSPHEGLVDWHFLPDGIEQQAAYVCETLIPAIQARRLDTTLGDIAVLYPSRHDGNVISKAAAKASINYTRIDQDAAYRKTPLMRWLEQCAAWCSGGWVSGEPSLSFLMRTWLRFNPSVSSQSQVRRLKRLLIRMLVDNRSTNQPLLIWLHRMEQSVLHESFAKESALRDEVAEFRRLKDAAKPQGELEWCTVSRFGAQQGVSNYLNLITLHSSKGREFHAVIVMGCDDGKLPSGRTEEDREENRRLFYVGLTRAKFEFHMTYSGGFRTSRGKWWQKGVSPFLLEIKAQAEKAAAEDDDDCPF